MARLAPRAPSQIPQVHKHPRSPQLDPILRRGFHRRYSRRRKIPIHRQRLHRPIASTRRNQRSRRRSAFERKIQRSRRPLRRLLFAHKRWLHQNKHSQIHVAFVQPIRRRPKLLQRHSLIQPTQNLRMHRLQSHCNFQPPMQAIPKCKAVRRCQSRMALNNHPFKAPDPRGNRSMVLQWNRPPVKKTPAVVELHLPRCRQLLQRVIDLRWNCTSGGYIFQSVLPQIAHQAAPRALAIRQKDRRYRHNLPRRAPFLLDKKKPWPPRIDRVPQPPSRKDPRIARRSVFWISRQRSPQW